MNANQYHEQMGHYKEPEYKVRATWGLAWGLFWKMMVFGLLLYVPIALIVWAISAS